MVIDPTSFYVQILDCYLGGLYEYICHIRAGPLGCGMERGHNKEGLMDKLCRGMEIAFSGMEELLVVGITKGARSVMDSLGGK